MNTHNVIWGGSTDNITTVLTVDELRAIGEWLEAHGHENCAQRYVDECERCLSHRPPLTFYRFL